MRAAVRDDGSETTPAEIHVSGGVAAFERDDVVAPGAGVLRQLIAFPEPLREHLLAGELPVEVADDLACYPLERRAMDR